MPLTDAAIRQAKPRERDWKLADDKGLFILVTSRGSKLWRLKYRHNGTEKKLALGAFPELGLKEARARRDDARRTLASGVDPSRERRAAKAKALVGAATTFEAVAREYIEKCKKEGRAEATLAKAEWFLSLLRPALGNLPIGEITPLELLAPLRNVERAGHRETASRLRSFASRVFRYAIATARAGNDPAQPLIGALAAPVTAHHPAVTDPKALGALLRAIDGYTGQPATIYALKLTPHIFQRPGEIRQAEWTEIDFEKAVWTIPVGRMKVRGKGRSDHHVPLSRQALDVLRNVQTINGTGRYVFPSLRSASRPLSENTVNAALRRLGYGGDEMTAHGFRTTASTLLNESGLWSPDAIERSLAHSDRDQIRGAYNRSPYWSERVQMAQWWSDYLDGLRSSGKVVPFAARAA